MNQRGRGSPCPLDRLEPERAPDAAWAEEAGHLWERLLSEPVDAERVVVVDDGVLEVRAGVIVAQALHLGNAHREQICAILTSLGIEPPGHPALGVRAGDRADLGTNRCPLTAGAAQVCSVPPREAGPGRQRPEEGAMALDDPSRGRARNKARNKSQELKGQVKEAAGRVTDNPRLEAEGRADQTKANLKQAAEKVKDALRPRR
jgi:uncharacterized protein YjbJ (UPF0337 family)